MSERAWKDEPLVARTYPILLDAGEETVMFGTQENALIPGGLTIPREVWSWLGWPEHLTVSIAPWTPADGVELVANASDKTETAPSPPYGRGEGPSSGGERG